MAQLTAPTAEQVYSASKLTPAHFEQDVELCEEDIVAMIDAEILPAIVSDVNLTVDEVAAPFDYPFSAETLAHVYPGRSDAANAEWVVAQDGRWNKVILWECLAELYTRVASMDEAYDRKAEMYKKWAKDKRLEATKAIKEVVARTAEVMGQGAENAVGVQIFFPCQDVL